MIIIILSKKYSDRLKKNFTLLHTVLGVECTQLPKLPERKLFEDGWPGYEEPYGDKFVRR